MFSLAKYMGTKRQQRRPIGYLNHININQLHLKSPGVVSWWSASFPGFGHIMLGEYLKGFILIIWEYIANIMANLNLAIWYSFNGRFSMAKNVLDKRWAILYLSIYLYAIWDSYCRTTDLNKYFILAQREKSPIKAFSIDGLGINHLDKRNPWTSLAWSMILPGLGHFYIRRVLTSFIIVVAWMISIRLSHALDAIYFTLYGEFTRAINVVNYQWLLFLPSIYGFSLYDSYITTVEYNKLFKYEQRNFLREYYQSFNFNMPF